jgi:diguanylate cyclase (GGDEF)-like protein
MERAAAPFRGLKTSGTCGSLRPEAADGTLPLAESVCAGLIDAAVGVALLDDAGVVRFANRRFEQALGLEALAGCRLDERVPGLTVPTAATRADVTSSTARGVGGGRLELVWTVNPAGGWIVALAGTAREAPALRAEAQGTDELTGLGTRAHLQAALDAWTSGRGARQPDVVALHVGLDLYRRATEILDPEGCAALLKRAAQRLRQATRGAEVLARLGEDTFAILIETRDGAEGAEGLAGRIVEIMSRPFVVAGEQIILGASVGLAALSQSGGSADDLLRLAGIAMQNGRSLGHGRVQWYAPSMGDAIRERRFIEMGLRRALLLDEFEVHYQPQFAFADRSISGFEALIRWRHPERGLISPAEFIPTAEESGLMPAIGAWVLREACAAAARWEAPLTVAVNVSPLQFEEEGFADVVTEALAASGLAPERLELELTEAVLLADTPETVARMHALRAIGVRLALDDFGVGFSSLNYLRSFPFDKIKVDQSFVRGPTADGAALRIVAAVANLGEAFGMSVLAEGVETEAQLENLRQRGCTGVQGYLFSKPIEGSRVDAFVANFTAPAAPGASGQTKEQGL